MHIVPKNISLPLFKKEQINHDVVSFYFDRTNVSEYTFLPGQYNRVTIPTVENDPRGSSRMFSIASSPLEKEYLLITTKISQSPFKQALSNLSIGSKVDFFGPVGRFVFDEADTRTHIFLSGGIGLTPFHSMITYAATKNIQTPITMISSFSTYGEFIYFDELSKISSEHKNITVVYTVTKSEQGDSIGHVSSHPDSTTHNPADTSFSTRTQKWTGETGRINSMMIQKYVSDFQKCLFYICGSKAVTDALFDLVKSMGISEEQIKKEQFPGY